MWTHFNGSICGHTSTEAYVDTLQQEHMWTHFNGSKCGHALTEAYVDTLQWEHMCTRFNGSICGHASTGAYVDTLQREHMWTRILSLKYSNCLNLIVIFDMFFSSSGIDICATLPCQNDGICSYNQSTKFTCQCVDGWLGRYCGYRFENPVADNNSLMVLVFV